MSVACAKHICKEYGVPRMTLPIRREDTVKIVRGKFKEEAPSKVVTVNRSKYRLYIENVQRERGNGATVKVPIHYSNVILTKLKLDGYRKRLIAKLVERKKNCKNKIRIRRQSIKKKRKERKKRKKTRKSQSRFGLKFYYYSTFFFVQYHLFISCCILVQRLINFISLAFNMYNEYSQL